MLVITMIVSLLIFENMKIGYPKFDKVQQTLDHLNGTTREFLSSVRVVKAFHAEQQETDKFENASENLAAANVFAVHTLAVFSPLINLTVNLGIVSLLYISKDQNSTQIGKLMASVNYMTQVLFAVGMLSGIMDTAVRAAASSARIREVLDEVPAQSPSSHPIALPAPKGEIDFEHVSFTYRNAGKEALKNVSFHVSPGETIGIIGPTGSGKSTLVSLVPRLYDASNGIVRFDGYDVTKISEDDLRQAVAAAAQKALLFTGTIAENIRWGKETASDEEVRRAAQIACADSFIEKMADGYQTLLGQGGVNLSGGQKQRISLARALVGNPKVLILDDCTSALDAQTEAMVLAGLRRHTCDMTILLISQRISTVMRADRILCLDNGEVQGYGSHSELMKNCEIYRAIYESQIGGGVHGE